MGNILTKQFYRQRKDFEDSCAGRDAGLTFPEGVRCSTDIAYADDGIKAEKAKTVDEIKDTVERIEKLFEGQLDLIISNMKK